MALDKAGLKAAFLAAMNDKRANKTSDEMAQQLADAIDTFVKTGTVNVTSVSGVTPGGGVSGPGTGTIS
jgi:hypothetical protein